MQAPLGHGGDRVLSAVASTPAAAARGCRCGRTSPSPGSPSGRWRPHRPRPCRAPGSGDQAPRWYRPPPWPRGCRRRQRPREPPPGPGPARSRCRCRCPPAPVTMATFREYHSYDCSETLPRARRRLGALMTSAYNARASRSGDQIQLRALLSTAIFRSGPPTAMQHGELRAPFMQVHAHMYHRCGPPSAGWDELLIEPIPKLRGRPTLLWHQVVAGPRFELATEVGHRSPSRELKVAFESFEPQCCKRSYRRANVSGP